MERMLGIDARFQWRRPAASTQKQKRLSLEAIAWTHKALFLLYSCCNVTVQAWTKTHANFNKLVEAKYDDKEFYENLKVARNNIKEVYTNFFDQHVAKVAKLTNMEYRAGRLNQNRRVQRIEDVHRLYLTTRTKTT
jgi:acyl-CoA hydrolase